MKKTMAVILVYLLVLPTGLCVLLAFLSASTNDGWLLRLLCLTGAILFGYAANAVWTKWVKPSKPGTGGAEAPWGLISLWLLLTGYVVMQGVATDKMAAARQQENDREMKRFREEMKKLFKKGMPGY